MKFEQFIKDLFNTESVKGYMIGSLEIYVTSGKDNALWICKPEEAISKVTIIPTEITEKEE